MAGHGGGFGGDGALKLKIGPLSAASLFGMMIGAIIAPIKWPVMTIKVLMCAAGMALIGVQPHALYAAPGILFVAYMLRNEV